MEKAHSRHRESTCPWRVKEKPENFPSYLRLKHFDMTNLKSPANQKNPHLNQLCNPKTSNMNPNLSNWSSSIGCKGAYAKEENSSTD